MKNLFKLVDTSASRDPRNSFGAAWLAAFLGFVLIIGVVFWAISTIGNAS